MRREKVKVRLPSLRGAKRRSNPSFFMPPDGLLRFARNDGHTARSSWLFEIRIRFDSLHANAPVAHPAKSLVQRMPPVSVVQRIANAAHRLTMLPAETTRANQRRFCVVPFTP
jgi:hypothetical protein